MNKERGTLNLRTIPKTKFSVITSLLVARMASVINLKTEQQKTIRKQK